jgi:hypothetical protein
MRAAVQQAPGGGQARYTAYLGDVIMQIYTRSIKWLSLLSVAALAVGCAEIAPQGEGHAKPDARQNFIRIASFACLTLSLREDRSVKCSLNYHDKTPVLQISFEGGDKNKIREKIKTYGPLVLTLLGPDLCAAAKSEFGAALTLVDTKSHQATTYSCEQQNFTTWVEVAEAKAQ